MIDIPDKRRASLRQAVAGALDSFAQLPATGLGAFIRIEAALAALLTLEDICARMDDDPYPALSKVIDEVARLPSAFLAVLPHTTANGPEPVAGNEHSRTAELFQKAWTTYDDATYDHSVGLVEERLRRSGFDSTFFKGKVCFDGGCGTGRLAVAMAKAGAHKVVALDIGGESLEYLRRTCARYGIDSIEVVEHDVTDLAPFRSDSFDFVASNGVLHHTHAPDRGIAEHFRITRVGGIFWIYLYGAGGIYWDTYDQLRPLVATIEPRTIREILSRFNLRKGLIYTFLDNLQAPRVYYSLKQTLDLLRPIAEFAFVHARGRTPIDDTALLMATRWGREIFGPDGEIRLAITKASPHAVAAR